MEKWSEKICMFLRQRGYVGLKKSETHILIEAWFLLDVTFGTLERSNCAMNEPLYYLKLN
jgi:hypothetical protein